MRSGGAFSDEEIQLLRGLPAVSNVTRDRITYSDTFRQVCTIRYLAGESPTKIFREAGLPPELVGYKRIERRVLKTSPIRPLSRSLPQRLRRMTFIRCLSDCSTVIRPALLSGSRLVVSTSSSAMW